MSRRKDRLARIAFAEKTKQDSHAAARTIEALKSRLDAANRHIESLLVPQKSDGRQVVLLGERPPRTRVVVPTRPDPLTRYSIDALYEPIRHATVEPYEVRARLSNGAYVQWWEWREV